MCNHNQTMKKSPIYVAIADDHAMFRKGVITQLQQYKHIQFILEAANGQELVEQLFSARQLPDICILDISMQPMNGYETANAIRDNWPKMKTIALTMLDEEYCIINMLRNGARGLHYQRAGCGCAPQSHRGGTYPWLLPR